MGGLDLQQSLDFLEFRQDLLFSNTDFDRLLFEYRVTRQQKDEIFDLMDKYRKKICNHEEVFHGTFEDEIYEIIPEHNGDYHFAEFIAQDLHRNGQYEEVFIALYGDMQKFQSYLSSDNNED